MWDHGLERRATLDFPMKIENRIFRPRTSTNRSHAAGHLVQAKSCIRKSLLTSPFEMQLPLGSRVRKSFSHTTLHEFCRLP